MMPPSDAVLRLCQNGLQVEGIKEQARAFYQQAWDARVDDYDACIAAHYLARVQPTPEGALRWNQEALDRANAVGDDRVRGFFASLYLNLGKSFEDMGDLEGARGSYDLAAARLDALSTDGYGEMVRRAVAAGQERVQASSPPA
jgi:hypothetical protein